jgi:hypothetical protein
MYLPLHGALSCNHLEASAAMIGKRRRCAHLRRRANLERAHVEDRTQGQASALHVRRRVWLGRADQPPVRRASNDVGGDRGLMGLWWRVRIHGHGGRVRWVSVADGELRVTCGSHTAG